MVNKDWLTPYNTGKVQIGCMYIPKTRPQQMSKDAYDLQTALLKSKRPVKQNAYVSRIKNLLSAVNNWRMK